MAAPVPEVAVPSTPKRSGSPVPSASPKRSGSGRAIDHLRAPIRGSDSRTTSAEGRASAETSEQARRASVLRMLQRGPQMSVKSAKWRHARHVAKSCKSSSTRSLRERLQRSDSRRTLIASNATFARKVLQEFASIPRPIYQPIDAVLYGTFIDWLVLFRCPVGPPLTRAIVKHGGAEQLRFLFCVATFDKDRNGKIDDDEWDSYERIGDGLIADSTSMCGNLAVVGALLLGLTHLVTIGRPTPYVIATDTADAFGGDYMLWVAYSLNTCSECGAFFTLCMAVLTRISLTNVLPSRELKIDFLRGTNALGTLGVSLMVTLWCFLLASITGALVHSHKIGSVGCGLYTVAMLMVMGYIAPTRYLAALLLHEEVKRFLLEDSGSFLKRVEKEQAERLEREASKMAANRQRSPSREGKNQTVLGRVATATFGSFGRVSHRVDTYQGSQGRGGALAQFEARHDPARDDAAKRIQSMFRGKASRRASPAPSMKRLPVPDP